LQHISKKSKPTESVQLHHHTVTGKRVVAPQQLGRVTRSRKLVTSEAPPIQDTSEVNVAGTQAELPIQDTSFNDAANTEAEIPTEDASGAHVATTEEHGPTLTFHTQGQSTSYCT
jgi:hypothetical protein